MPMLPITINSDTFEGLECNVENIPAGGKSGEILIWPVLHRFALALFPTPNGTVGNHEMYQCPAEFDYCLTMHCQALSTF
jgi:hypothetical protein